jgi:hypothetical protein
MDLFANNKESKNSDFFVMAISISGAASALRYNHIMPGFGSAFETSANSKYLEQLKDKSNPTVAFMRS